jgi:hypothetical protein
MEYQCPTYYKTVSEPSPRRLSELEEARGELLSVFCRDGFAVAGFAWGVVVFPAELEPRLREMVGKQCAILRLDGRYHCREA